MLVSVMVAMQSNDIWMENSITRIEKFQSYFPKFAIDELHGWNANKYPSIKPKRYNSHRAYEYSNKVEGIACRYDRKKLINHPTRGKIIQMRNTKQNKTIH